MCQPPVSRSCFKCWLGAVCCMCAMWVVLAVCLAGVLGLHGMAQYCAASKRADACDLGCWVEQTSEVTLRHMLPSAMPCHSMPLTHTTCTCTCHAWVVAPRQSVPQRGDTVAQLVLRDDVWLSDAGIRDQANLIEILAFASQIKVMQDLRCQAVMSHPCQASLYCTMPCRGHPWGKRYQHTVFQRGMAW